MQPLAVAQKNALTARDAASTNLRNVTSPYPHQNVHTKILQKFWIHIRPR